MNLRNASAPVRAIKRLLSHHEIATLLLLLHAPIDVMAATPDVASLTQTCVPNCLFTPSSRAAVFTASPWAL